MVLPGILTGVLTSSVSETCAGTFPYLASEKKVVRSSATVAIYRIRFLYDQILQRQWPTWLQVRLPRQKKLPVVLSREEVRRALQRSESLPRYTWLPTRPCNPAQQV